MYFNSAFRILFPLAMAAICMNGLPVAPAVAQSGFHASGWIVDSGQEYFELVLDGKVGGIGKFACDGELVISGDSEGGYIGSGVAVFVARNGDQLTGVVALVSDADGQGEISFSWRDSVELSNGTVIRTTGRFIKHRPPGASNRFQASPFGEPNGIIAILIGL